jgi:hypothetical protein
MDVRRGWVVFAAALLIAACDSDRLVEAPCREDGHCQSGLLCEDFVCVAAATKACDVVINGNPVLQPAPYTVDFGVQEGPGDARTVTLHNIGNCTLTLFEAQLAAGAQSPFTCEGCGEGFPLEIFPGRKRELQVAFGAPGIGSFSDHLVILSDDREFPEMRVPLHGQFMGLPELRVAPNPVDFGYVAQGRVGKKRVQITNQGTGVAELVVESVALVPASEDFSLVDAPTSPVRLLPMSADGEVLGVEAHFHPRSTQLHAAELVLQTSRGEVRVPVLGNALTPPKLSLNPTSIDLGEVPLGHTNVQALALLNEGGAPLEISYHWGGQTLTTDLFANPVLIPPIPAGSFVEVQVAVTATALGPLNGFMVLTTNDPARPSVTIPVSAKGVAGPGPEVVKVELTYDNGDDNAFDRDLRNVDLTLEHPYGYVCNKQYPNPSNWGTFGNPSWIAFGPKEEPERIVLADAQTDATYRLMVQYVEDCSAMPTELTAGILGISIDALLNYLSGGVVDVNGQDVGAVIEQTCFNRSATNATVRVWVNGAVIQEKTVALAKKGDSKFVLELVRSGGKFSAQ